MTAKPRDVEWRVALRDGDGGDGGDGDDGGAFAAFDLHISFTLGRGQYATVCLNELIKADVALGTEADGAEVGLQA